MDEQSDYSDFISKPDDIWESNNEDYNHPSEREYNQPDQGLDCDLD